MIKFFPLGGAGEIGASCFYFNIEGSGLILDSGMHPQKSGLDSLPNFNLLENLPVDYVLISHAHQDHISSLPFLVQKFPHIKVITTPQTRALAELVLHNSVSILKQQLKDDQNFKFYTHDEVDLLIKMIDYRQYEELFDISGYAHYTENLITAKFFDAGHILGSASILIEYCGKKILYTGDINLANQAILKGAFLPEENVDTIILETTYGATNSSLLPEWEKEELRLAKSINKVFNNGGSILIPVFSLGKTQEMLTVLWKLMTKGKLVLCDIYTGGIANKISRIYDYNRYVTNRINPDFELKEIPQKDLYKVDNFNEFFKNPCIVLASSGMMLEGTASYKLAKRWINQKDSAIFTVGYMEENTPGYRIANALQNSKIHFSEFGKPVEVKCAIENFRFSAHSKREELLNIVKKLKPKKVILVHGDPESIDWMGSSILREFKNIKLYGAENGKEIEI